MEHPKTSFAHHDSHGMWYHETLGRPSLELVRATSSWPIHAIVHGTPSRETSTVVVEDMRSEHRKRACKGVGNPHATTRLNSYTCSGRRGLLKPYTAVGVAWPCHSMSTCDETTLWLRPLLNSMRALALLLRTCDQPVVVLPVVSATHHLYTRHQSRPVSPPQPVTSSHPRSLPTPIFTIGRTRPKASVALNPSIARVLTSACES